MEKLSCSQPQGNQFLVNMMDLVDVDELRTSLFNTFLQRQITRKISTKASCQCETGLACKGPAKDGFPESSADQRAKITVAFIYINDATLQLIIDSGSLAQATTASLVAINVAPFRTNVSRALLLQSINLLRSGRCGLDDISHFIAIAISKDAFSKTLTMAPFEGDLARSFMGFPITSKGDAAFEMVAYGRNLMPKACAESFPSVDLLYDYRNFFESCRATGRIGDFPEGVSKPKVAIVGAGLSGLVVASELLHAGIDDVTLYEASDRIGGKLWSYRFDNAPNVVAEMGAMRFPPSESCLFFFLKKYGLDSMGRFPNPGSVDTTLIYDGHQYIWKAGEGPPELFRRVYHGWQAFIREGYLNDDMVLASPCAIGEALKLGHLQQAHDFWQSWLTCFGRESFSSGIEKIFLGSHPPGGEKWAFPHDWDLFKLLGIGSGGFGPVFESGFIEILRLVVNGYEDNAQLIYEGISELPRRIGAQVVHGVSIRERIRHVQVKAIEKENTKIRVRVKGGNSDLYDRVVVTSGLTNIQLRHLLTLDATFLQAEVNGAVENSHMTGSSKLFVLTEGKFWLEHQLPPCVLTTGVARAVYCFDYEPKDPRGKGLVLISYTWEDDSHKLLAVPDKRERLALLRRDIGKTLPDFAKHLVPANGNYDGNVVQHDWLTDPNAGGAFKLNRRGEDVYSQRLFFQPFDVMNSLKDKGLYLAGCSCSFTGGWADGAIQTACNAACAVIHSSGGVLAEGNPLTHPWKQYNYGVEYRSVGIRTYE
ncbi:MULTISPECIES: FAD-dependent oxidoreductase [Rhizobium/Agrobacterium group]|nr:MULTISPECIES: FAD-dependent oxidoreductase [Rhizobium/Agrobacterium group]